MAILTGCWTYDFLALLIGIITVIYLYFQWMFGYWKRLGIPESFVPPSFPFGHMKNVSITKNLVIAASERYNESTEKVSGFFLFSKPILLVRDPDIVKDMLVKEFSSFHDRGFTANTKIDPLASHLFILNGQEWRNLRIKLTPTFTSGKMKMMFPTLFAVGDDLIKVLDKHVTEPEVEIKDILARYTTDVISSVAFGIECKSLENPNCDFRRHGSSITTPDLRTTIAQMMLFTFPNMQDYLPIRIVPKQISDFFIDTVRNVMDYRQTNNVKRNDFLQLLLQLKTLGYIPDADDHSKDQEQDIKPFTLEIAAAQAFLFFFAGFETSSATMQFALYELALNPQLQKQVQDEIEAVAAKHDGAITYEGLSEMDLLDRVVAETLRKYPIAGFLLRRCNKDYKVPGMDITIPKDTDIWIPVYGHHHDPQYYPEPEKFDPDRFLPEEKEKRHHFVYLPFGEGPRNCIGNRFALMQTKAGLAIILRRYNISPSKRTPIPMEFSVRANVLTAKGGMYLKLSKRN